MRVKSLVRTAGVLFAASLWPLQANAASLTSYPQPAWLRACSGSDLFDDASLIRTLYCSAQLVFLPAQYRLTAKLVPAVSASSGELVAAVLNRAAPLTGRHVFPRLDLFPGPSRCSDTSLSCTTSWLVGLLQSPVLEARVTPGGTDAASVAVQASGLQKRTPLVQPTLPDGSPSDNRPFGRVSPQSVSVSPDPTLQQSLEPTPPERPTPLDVADSGHPERHLPKAGQPLASDAQAVTSAQEGTSFDFAQSPVAELELKEQEQEANAVETVLLKDDNGPLRNAAEQQRSEEERRVAAELKRQEEEAERARIAAEQERLEQERIAAEQQRLEEERRIAAELKRQEEEAERARIAAEQERLEQERIAAEQQRLEEERRVAAELKRQEEEAERARIAAEQERIEQERIAAEQQRLEEERRIAAELKRQEEEAERARIAAEQERLEQERIAAEQQRLEEERRVAAELKRQEEESERARIAAEQERLEQERIAAEQQRLEEEQQSVSEPLFVAESIGSDDASEERDRLAAERRALLVERNSLEKEKLAFERKQLEQERRALAAERRRIAKERRALQGGATDVTGAGDDLSAVASVIQELESDDQRAEQEARLLAERQRMERERQRRIAAERRRLARQRRLEKEKMRLAAEQERLEQQRRQLAVEQQQLDQELVASEPTATQVFGSGVANDVVAKVDSLRNPPLMLAGVPTVRAAFIDSEGNTPFLKQNPFTQRPVGTGDPLSDDVKRIMRVKQDLRRLDIALSTVKPQPTTYLARGNVKYSLGDYKGASRDYQRAIDSDPQLADAYINRGAALRKSGRLGEAIASYNKVIAMRPGDASAYRNRGIAREAQGDVQGAVADWRTASRLGDTEVLQWIAAATQPPTMAKTVGSVLAQVAPAVPTVGKSNKLLLAEANGLLAKGSPGQARDLYIKILQKDASDRKALFNLAVAFRKSGQYKEALLAYDKYLAVVPDDAQAYRNRGIVKEMQRNLKGACADWSKAYDLGANDVKSWLNNQCQ